MIGGFKIYPIGFHPPKSFELRVFQLPTVDIFSMLFKCADVSLRTCK